jgi:hypothetical protein
MPGAPVALMAPQEQHMLQMHLHPGWLTHFGDTQQAKT